MGRHVAFMGVPSVEDRMAGFSSIRYLLLYTTRVTKFEKDQGCSQQIEKGGSLLAESRP